MSIAPHQHPHASRLAVIVLAVAAATTHASAFGDTETWSFDLTTTGQDLNWISPTATDPNSIGYFTEFEMVALEVGVEFLGLPFGPFDVLDGIPAEDLMGSGTGPGPAPIGVLDLSIEVPPPPDPLAVAGNLSVGLDAAGFGFLDFTNVVLGTVDVDLGFPFGTVTADLTSLRMAGNISVTPTQWLDLGAALEGTAGLPGLFGEGSLLAGEPLSLTLSGALAGSTTALVIGLAEVGVPFKGGVMVPSPDVILPGLPIGPTGDLVLSGTWPPGFPPGFVTYYQHWITDAGAVKGFSASNGVSGTTS